MATALEIITASVEDLGVKTAESPLEAFEVDRGISELNDMMLAAEADGITLGYVEVDAGSDAVTVPKWALGAIKSSLAVRLAPSYQKSITPELAAKVKSTMNTVVSKIVGTIETDFPSTLPKGSGSADTPFDGREFFPQAD